MAAPIGSLVYFRIINIFFVLKTTRIHDTQNVPDNAKEKSVHPKNLGHKQNSGLS